ncbi:MAG: DUF3458 domain-containing protein, partial [Gammaproteobacteria bacterium]|nr:DUF3458 domain-containing protein [Gammaproteobacteria bacterium]
PATPAQDENQPSHIPVKISLMDNDAQKIVLQMPDEKPTSDDSVVLNFVEEQQRFEFENVEEKPVLSILQGYSAPVKLHFERNDEELAFCMAHEADDFNRWEAGQQLSSRLILSMVESIKKDETLVLPDYYVAACKKILVEETLDKALIARAVTLPSLMYIGEMMPVIDVDEIHQAREFIYSQLAQQLKNELLDVYQKNSQQTFSLSPESMAKRFLRNQSLAYLLYLEGQGESLALTQFYEADNMTDQMAAFKSLVHHEAANSSQIIDEFYQQWKHDNLVMDKWFSVQATIPQLSSIPRVQKLFEHPDFDIKNPNRVRSLLGVFCAANPRCFHEIGGFGYDLLGQYIETIDAMNPQIASRLCVPLTRWKRYNETRQNLMRSELKRLISLPKLSNDVTELVEKSLK